MRRPLVAAVVAALALAAVPPATCTANAAAAQPLRITPLGDSITGSPG